MLVDNISLIIKAGNGGNGAATFLRNARTMKGGPDGGNGGNGGNIYFRGSSNVNDLSEFRFKKKIMAEDGIDGKRKNLYGKNASHVTILVPLGTQIIDSGSARIYEITDPKRLLLLAKGGKGGRGNKEFRSATNQTPFYAEKGGEGDEKKLFLTLRLIADIGLIGLPNAGKSSLLAVLTHATPKIGNYPFTTLEPNIGMMENYPIADIPGLIEGASEGRGLGTAFLRHIEKTKILVHCVDSQDKDIDKAYETVRSEFKKYNPLLLEKPEIILLTKTDIAEKELIKKNIDVLKKKEKKVLTCSIYDPESITSLKQILKNTLSDFS